MHRFAFRITLGAVLCAAACAALAGEITVYTNLESDEVAEYVKVAQKDLPDIKVNVLRLSTGDLAARLAAESANPRNDVIWALSLTNMLDPRILALTEAYTPAGSSAPCKLASKGEFAIGASLAEAAIKSVKEGFPVKMVIPAEGAGYELGANALMAAAKNKADARRFLDWTLSPNAVQAYSRNKEIVTVKGATPSADMRAAGLPEDVTSVLFKMDFAASAATRGDTLKRWKADIGR